MEDDKHTIVDNDPPEYLSTSSAPRRPPPSSSSPPPPPPPPQPQPQSPLPPQPPPPPPPPSPPPPKPPSPSLTQPEDQSSSLSKDDDANSTPVLNNEELNVIQIEPKSNPVSTYSIVDGEIDNKFATSESRENPKNNDENNSITTTNNNNNNVPKLERANEFKIMAKPSPADEDGSPMPLHNHRRNVSMDHIVAKVPNTYFTRAQSTVHRVRNPDALDRGIIDTTAPFESVKAAVSKFGGIVDWKAHRVQTVERRKFIENELAKAQEEIPVYKQQCEEAEKAKKQVMKDLDSTRRLIEELKLNLERAQTEEQQAKQDSELAKLRVEELEQGITDEVSFAAKAQLEVAKARHAAAVSELKMVKEELEQLRMDYESLLSEKDLALRKAEEAVAASKEIEKSVEDLTIELLTVKQSLESAHAAHLEAEEHRIAAVMAKEQETHNWEKELRQSEEELEMLYERVEVSKELKLKLSNATELLQDLKAELATYMEAKPEGIVEESCVEEALAEPEKKTRAQIHIAIATAKRELAEVRQNIEKTNDEVIILKVAATSLKLDLEKETAELSVAQQREGSAIIMIGSLEAELNRIKLEINEIQLKEKEERERMGDLPKRIQEAALDADHAKGLLEKARDALQNAKEEAEQAKAGAITKEARLLAVQREIEAAKTTEKLALAAMTALQESELSEKKDDSSMNGITLSLEEYYELSKRAHEAEEQANARIASALAQVEAAKESESRSLDRLENVTREVSNRKEALESAARKAEEAMKAKQAIEHELRKWRENDEKRKAAAVAEAEEEAMDSSGDEGRSTDGSSETQKSGGPGSSTGPPSTPDKPVKKKKKSFFPRIFMFLVRRKSSSSSSSSRSSKKG